MAWIVDILVVTRHQLAEEGHNVSLTCMSPITVSLTASSLLSVASFLFESMPSVGDTSTYSSVASISHPLLATLNLGKPLDQSRD